MRAEQPGAGRAWGWFGIQLALNTLWSFVFFGMEMPGAAFVEIVALWLAIVLTIAAFRTISPIAAALLLPYLAWVTFASVLNATLWRLNPGA
jgi:tryptophan-rich sensory protein